MKRNNLKKIFFTLSVMIIFFISSIPGIFATTARYAWNFDDIIPENHLKINDNTYNDMENLAVVYNLNEGSVIVRGVNYMYNNEGVGPYSVELRFEGDSYWVGYYDTNIPHVTTDSWRTFYCAGPTYLIDNDPAVLFIGMQPSDNCITLCADTPSIGNSFYNVGSGWQTDTNYEYIVELIYEYVTSIENGVPLEGEFTASDNLDAYNVSLIKDHDYVFNLDCPENPGNLKMRLLKNKDLTNDVLRELSTDIFPQNMIYTPEETNSYILLVETVFFGDTVDYTISVDDLTDTGEYIDHDPINIDGNSELEAFISAEGFSGNGTIENPYIIQNFNFDSDEVSYLTGLKINNIETYLTIKNCKFLGGSTGLTISNSFPINVINCEVLNGIEIISTDNCSILYNHCWGQNNGILITDSDNINVTKNMFVENLYSGIMISESSDVVIKENICNSNLKSGIELQGDYCEIYMNNCSFNSDNGIKLKDSYENLIEQNTCDRNSKNGILISGERTSYSSSLSKYNIIKRNYCSENLEYGIFIEKENTDNEIFENVLIDNEKGCYKDEGKSFLVPSGNSIYDNTCEGEPQGYWWVFFLILIIFGFPTVTILIIQKKQKSNTFIKSTLNSKQQPRLYDPHSQTHLKMPPRQLSTAEIEKKLIKFISILKASNKIKIETVADLLNMTKIELWRYLADWTAFFSFKVTGDMIITAIESNNLE